MNPGDYNWFTERLRARLEADERVLALGSMAEAQRELAAVVSEEGARGSGR